MCKNNFSKKKKTPKTGHLNSLLIRFHSTIVKTIFPAFWRLPLKSKCNWDQPLFSKHFFTSLPLWWKQDTRHLCLYFTENFVCVHARGNLANYQTMWCLIARVGCKIHWIWSFSDLSNIENDYSVIYQT